MMKPFPKMFPETKLNRAGKLLETYTHKHSLHFCGLWEGRSLELKRINVKSMKTNPEIVLRTCRSDKDGPGSQHCHPIIVTLSGQCLPLKGEGEMELGKAGVSNSILNTHMHTAKRE